MSYRRYTTYRSERAMSGVTLRSAQDLRRWMYSLGLLSVVTVLILVYLSQAGRVEREKERMWGLEATIQTLKRENSNLVGQIGLAQDLSALRERAKALGLGPAASVEYVEVVVNREAPLDLPGVMTVASDGSTRIRQGPSWLQSLAWQFSEWVRSYETDAATSNP
jgi:hypothetical protein